MYLKGPSRGQKFLSLSLSFFLLCQYFTPFVVFAELNLEKENKEGVEIIEGLLTPELEILNKVKPELTETYKEKKDKKLKEKIKIEENDTSKEVLKNLKKDKLEEVLKEKGLKNTFNSPVLENKRRRSEVLEEQIATKEVVSKLKKEGIITTLEKEGGEEVEINPTLKEKLGGSFETEETPYEAKVSKSADKGIVIAEKKEASGKKVNKKNKKKIVEDKTPRIKEEVRYFPRNAAETEAVNEGNKLLYRNMWKETDLLLTTTEEGVKEDIILKNKQAPKYFDYIVETIGLELEMKEDGGFVFIDSTGQEKFYTPAPDITDAQGKKLTKGIEYKLGWGDEEEKGKKDGFTNARKEFENSNLSFLEEKRLFKVIRRYKLRLFLDVCEDCEYQENQGHLEKRKKRKN